MQGPLPLASYAFILRKHLWLVLGTVAVVLAGGWLYGRTQDPVWEAKALVQLQQKVGVPAGQQVLVLTDDRGFVNDQCYRLKYDDGVAKKVLEHLREPPEEKAPPGPAGTADDHPLDEGPEEPPRPDPSLFKDLEPRNMPGMITVGAVPTTSFYQLSVTSRDRKACVALVNAYAQVFARVFAKDRSMQVERVVQEYEARQKVKKAVLDQANKAIEAFKVAHSSIDFEPGAPAAKEKEPANGAAAESKRPAAFDRGEAERLGRELSTERGLLDALEHQNETVGKALASADLKLVPDEKAGFRIVPALKEGSAGEPRLSERVQALDVVSLSDGVRRANSAIAAAEAEDLELVKSKNMSPEMKERQDIQARIEKHRMALARATDAAIVQLSQKAVESRAKVDTLQRMVGELTGAISDTNKALAEFGTLQENRKSAQAAVDDCSRLIFEAEGERKRIEDGGGTVRVYRFAQAEDSHMVSPNMPVIYLTTAVAALLLAAGLAYVLEYLDDTVKTREDFDRLVRLPFLGYVPHIRDSEGTPRDLVVSRGKTGSPEVESFRAIRTGIQFSRPDREIRSFLITSAGPGEGKTTVSVNLASAFTGAKGRVLLVDADLRRARVHSALGIDNARGLTNVLVGETTLEETVQRSCVEGLDVLASGPIPPNPAEVLGSERMQQLLRDAAGRWDRVIIDSPPLVAVTDPSLLAKYVDAVFLVISIGKTSIRTIQRARETLSTVGVGVHGAILNNADVKISGYAQYYGGYGYGYGYGYGTKA